MDLKRILRLLKERGVDIDLECVYSVNYCGEKMLVAYQGNIVIDKDKV